VIYLDNAATTFPKPRQVLERMVQLYAERGVSPGRGSYDLAVEAAESVYSARQELARFFGAPDPDRVIFTANATDALNLAIQGVVRPGDHVVSTRLEHNSVLRPLDHLRAAGVITYTLVPFGADGRVDPEVFAAAITPRTTLAVVTHASSVLGTVQPVAAVAAACAARGVPLVVDAAQSAGHIPVRLTEWGVAAVAFTGHKALMGPTGTGGLVVSPDLDVRSTRYGGTGIESLSLTHTQSYPHRLEAGTLNLMGIIGLSLGLEFVQAAGLAPTHRREMQLVGRLRTGLEGLQRLTILSPPPTDDDLPVLTCMVPGMSSDDVGAILDADYGIAVRTGLHCAPLVHTDLGTIESGAVRFSLGHFTSEDDIDRAVAAMTDIVTLG
jgi:cysteine desulfurase family protein